MAGNAPGPGTSGDAAATVENCTWKQGGWDESSLYETACGQAFLLSEGTPTDNKFRFCVFCGQAIIEVPHAEEPDEE